MKSFILLLCLFWAGPVLANQKPLEVVTTQTLFADLVKKVGGEHVRVKSVASPKYNVHYVQPKPSDVKNVMKADLYVHAGLDLESWSQPLLEAAGNSRLFANAIGNLDLSRGIDLLKEPGHGASRAEGDIHLHGNPHYHMDPRNLAVMTKSITAKLKELDPAHASDYESGAAEVLRKLNMKMAEWKRLQEKSREQAIISYHDDIAYLADFLGLHAEHFIEPKPGIPPTAKHLQFLEGYAKEHHVRAIVMPSYYPKGTAEKFAKRLGVKVLIIVQNAGEIKGTEDVFEFFDYNIGQLAEVM